MMRLAREIRAAGLVLLLLAWPALGRAQVHDLASPDGNVKISFALSAFGDETGCPVYSVQYREREIVKDARLGLTLKGAPALEGGFEAVGATRRKHDETYSLVYGERRQIRNAYRELTVELRERQAPRRILRLTFRAYNEGAAFCYTLPRQPDLEQVEIAKEQTQFRFTADHRAWAVYSAQGEYKPVPLSQVKRNCERPLTLEIVGGPAVAVGEARLVDYARMKLSPAPGQPLTLVSELSGPVRAETPLTTPWRVILLGDTPGQLLERNHLFLSLNDPCAIADTSWIKPGKVIREVTLTTAGGKACVDFAAKHNLQYVEFDAGWYGHEYDAASDARTVTVDPKRSKGPLDLPAVIEYADARGIGILLYVNRRALEKQLDELLPLLQKWGVKGVKYGFVNVGSQQWTTWLHEAVRKAAAHQLMVDVHDEYRPTGYSRTYPNLMTQEGIRGNETMPTAAHNCVLPFTRMLCGAGDYTICYYTDRIKTTHAHQLAASVVFYSPWNFLFWYDRPAAYQGEPEIEFFERLPTVWDETRVIHGEIGEYVTVARRYGVEWFVATLNGGQARTLNIPLAFLKSGRHYHASIYEDAPPNDTSRTKVHIRRDIVDRAQFLTATLPADGGQAVWLGP